MSIIFEWLLCAVFMAVVFTLSLDVFEYEVTGHCEQCVILPYINPTIK